MAALVLVLLLIGVHLWVAEQWGQIARLSSLAPDTVPARIEVAFVTELKPTAAPPVKPVAPAPTVQPAAPVEAAAVAPLPASPASAPDSQAPAPASPLAEQEPESPAAQPATDQTAKMAREDESERATGAAAEATAAAAAAAEAVAAAEAAKAQPAVAAGQAATTARSATATPGGFEWPPSTRLSYLLTGDYRGPVQGRASVEWLRSAERYQVHLDVRVGSDLLPLLSRRMSSDGRITASGLEPSRYDEETRVFLREIRRQTIIFEPGRVITPRGGVQPTYAGIQDTASQFVQLTWLFTTQPQRLQSGQTVELPLALTRRVDRWIYDVVGQENLDTPMGSIPAWYLRPRPENKTASDLAVETWFAPTLQYLPVRIRIRQDDATFIDLMLERPPQQEAAPRP